MPLSSAVLMTTTTTTTERSRPRLSDPYASLTTHIRKDTKMGEDIMCDLWFESQYEVPEFDPWEAEAEVIMAQWDEPDFF
jgi:hypothetical protein